jgi:hypothetical protein
VLARAAAGPRSRRAIRSPAVKGLAKALPDDDLVRYSQLSVPPALHKQMEARWHERLLAAAPPTPAPAEGLRALDAAADRADAKPSCTRATTRV